MSFNAKEVKDKCVEWIREWFKENGNQCKAVIGISGGVDSSVVAALCVEALGKERVYGVLMPQNSQDDIDYSYELCEHLGIEHSDGLCGKTDEENLGFSYDVLDKYIRTGEIEDMPKKRSIDTLHMLNDFKMKPMAHFEYTGE